MKDSEMIRGNVPMTKEEVRAVILHKLELQPRDVFVDVGAGTGSVSIEVSKAIPDGKVISIEHNSEAVDLIRQNIEKHIADNIEIRHTKAPVGLDKNDEATKYFIGGSGGNLIDILNQINACADSKTIVVVSAIVIDTMTQAYDYFRNNNYETELVQIAVSKVETGKTPAMLMAANPVFVIKAIKK